MLKFSPNQIKSVSDLQKHYREVLESAKKEPVLVVVHNKPRAVIISIEKFGELTQDDK